MMRRNVAATSLKIVCKNLHSVKFYDKTNMNAFALSLCEKISWGLTYFGQFNSVGRCVIPWEFLGKSVKHTFSCRKMYLVEEKRCFQFFLDVLTSL